MSDLITLKAVKALNKADVVLYDYLANEEILAHAPEDAEKIYVGKKAGDAIQMIPPIIRRMPIIILATIIKNLFSIYYDNNFTTLLYICIYINFICFPI